MDEAEIERFKATLVRLKADLRELEDVSGDAARPVELDQSRVGRVSRVDALQAQQMAQEASRRRKQQLVRVEAALRRIESGEYGGCFVCGEDIDVRRLGIDPTSTRCPECMDHGG